MKAEMDVEMTPVVKDEAGDQNASKGENQAVNQDGAVQQRKEPFVIKEPISKNQRKKLERQKKWLEAKPERRAKERQKEKERRAKRRQEATEKGIEMEKKPPTVMMADSSCKVTIVIDCDYGEFMGEDLMRKLCKQLTRCYASNRSSKTPVQFYLTSVAGSVKACFDTYQPGYVNWDCIVSDKHWTEHFIGDKKEVPDNLIYLTGDSPNITPEPKEIQASNNQVFIIGGLLDHNQLKGLSLKNANKAKVKHAKLPIGDHIQMCQRKILSIPHVFDIMSLASNGSIGQDWMEIFQKVIPARKIDGEETKKKRRKRRPKNLAQPEAGTSSTNEA